MTPRQMLEQAMCDSAGRQMQNFEHLQPTLREKWCSFSDDEKDAAFQCHKKILAENLIHRQTFAAFEKATLKINQLIELIEGNLNELRAFEITEATIARHRAGREVK